MTRYSPGTWATMLAAACAAVFALTGCASQSSRRSAARAEADATAGVASANAQIPRYRIRDWSVLNDHTLVVVGDDGTRYRAELLGTCVGLAFVTRLSFVNRGGFETIDRFSSVLLPDGTRCQFQSFDKLVSAESKALDRYEKSKEAKPEDEASDQEDAKSPQ